MFKVFLTRAALGPTSNVDLPPAEFLACHSAAFESSEDVIQAVFSNLLQRGYYLEKKWQTPKDAMLSPADRWVTLLNNIFRISSSDSEGWARPWQENRWRSHRARSLVEGEHEPGIVLVPNPYWNVDPVPFGAMLTCIEVRESDDDENRQAAALRLYQCAGSAMALQFNRSFFLGAMFLGRDLLLALFAYGSNNFYSERFNIDEEPILFIKTVIALSSGGLHPVLGFDPRGLKLGGMDITVLCRTWSKSVTTVGKGTQVYLCSNDTDGLAQFFALKDTWLHCGGPNDLVNNESLTIRKPKAMTKELCEIFGPQDKYDIFRDCRSTRGTNWDYETHLPGIPILKYAEVASFQHDGKLQDDTTEAIACRFSRKDLVLQPRVHIRTLSETCGVPLAWFPCRRAFLGGMMCVVAAHFNGRLKDILHCDISEPNIWICVDDPEDVDDVIPDWPEDPTLYPKHAVVLGDWGIAADCSPDTKVKNDVGSITGSFAYHAAEFMSEESINGKVAQDAYHDLEAMFWVMWIMSINTRGPYDQPRRWFSHPFSGLNREPADAVGKNKNVPVWATPGIHSATPQDIYEFKRSIPEHQFFNSISPYWSEGECGRAFKDGMRRLREHFVWVLQDDGTYASPKTITHQIFVEILADMRGSIPADQDRATPTCVEEARERYAALLGYSGAELGTPVLEAPTPLISGETSTSCKASPSGPTVGSLQNTQRRKRKASDVTRSSQEPDAKRSK